MTGVYNVDWGHHAALDDIVSIKERHPRREGQDPFFVKRRSDSVGLDLSAYALGKLLARPVQLMPAEAGTAVLQAWADGEEQGLVRTPVIAWALCFDGEVRPVTPQGCNDMRGPDDSVYVLMPNGTVQAIGDFVEPIWFDTLDEYTAHEVARIRAAAAEESAA